MCCQRKVSPLRYASDGNDVTLIVGVKLMASPGLTSIFRFSFFSQTLKR